MTQTAASVNIDEFSAAERVALLGRVWDSLIELNGLPGVPDWHLREVRRRIERADSNPGSAIPLETLRAELLGGNS